MRKAWKKIEHWLAVAIIIFVLSFGPITMIFSDELGLLKVRGGPGPDDVITDCPSDLRWPC